MERPIQSIFILLLSLFVSSPVLAFSIYGDLGYMYHDLDVGGAEVNPASIKFKIGIPITKNVAFETVYASGIEDDDVNFLDIEVEEILAAYIRFHSTMKGRGTHIYLIAGQANTTIATKGSSSVGDEDFEDFSWGIGAEEESKAIKNMYYTFEYTRFYDDDSLTVNGISLGVKYLMDF